MPPSNSKFNANATSLLLISFFTLSVNANENEAGTEDEIKSLKPSIVKENFSASKKENENRNSINFELSIPLNNFALKSLLPDSDFDGKTWNASFTPYFAPVAKLSAQFSWAKVSASRKLRKNNAFWAADAAVPIVDNLILFGFWRNWKGFDLQYSLEEAGAHNSAISYDNSRPTFDRSAVAFLDRSIGLEYPFKVPIPTELQNHITNGEIELALITVADFRNQELHSPQRLLTDDAADKFGPESTLQKLLQNSIGAQVGIEFSYALGHSQYFWNLDTGFRAILGHYFYESLPKVSKPALGFSAGTELGHRLEKNQQAFETMLRFEGTLNKASRLGFSSQYLLLKFAYKRYF